MKNLYITILIFLVSISFVQGQNVATGIAYQAVALKDGPHALGGQNAASFNWSNKSIQVRFTIFEKYPGGSNQYSEVHATKTDEYGVFNLIIGQGKVLNGVFDNIPWELGTAHLQVEIDFENNNTFKVTSLERFWSVPYAFVTRKSKGSNTDSLLNALNNKYNYLKNRDKDTVIGNEGGISYKSLDSLNQVLKAQLAKMKLADKDTVIGNEWQNLSLKKDSLLISNGKGIKLLDNDSLNEIQKLTRLIDTVSLSKNGGKFVLNDDDPKNELQELYINNDSLKLKNSLGGIPLNKLNPNGNQTTTDSLINIVCSNSSWMYGGGKPGQNLTSSGSTMMFNVMPIPKIVHGDTVSFGDNSYNFKTGEPIYFPINSQNGLQNAPCYINQDSILLTIGSNYMTTRSVTITSYPGNKIIFDMDTEYPGNQFVSKLKDKVRCAYYFKDTLAVLYDKNFIVFIPRKNKLLLDISLPLINGGIEISGFFQINNKYYLLIHDSLHSIDFQGNLKYITDLNYVDLWGQNLSVGQFRAKVCIPINSQKVFIGTEVDCAGLFLDLNNLSVNLFRPRYTMFPSSNNYFFDGKYIYHTRKDNGLNSSYQGTGFFTERIRVK